MFGPEIREVDATGEIARIFAEIRGTFRVPIVNQIYRRLAAVPGGLDWAWPLVQAVIRSGDLERAAQRLVEAVRFEEARTAIVEEMLRMGADSQLRAEVAAVLDAYNRSNPMNLLAVNFLYNALLAGRAAPSPTALTQSEFSAPTLVLPPLIDIDVDGPVLRETFLRLARQASGGKATIIPTLFRHLGRWPDFLESAANSIDTLVDSGKLALAARDLEVAAMSYARGLRIEFPSGTAAIPAPIGQSAKSIRDLFENFSPAISGMIVIGAWLRRHIPD